MKNIILIMADQFRGDCLGISGNRKIMTPHLDELASQGMYFPCAYSPSPTCVPARACMVTGMKAAKTGFFSNDFDQPWEYKETLMRTLQAGGYQTINVGKNHFKPLRSKLGFEVNKLYEVADDEMGTPSDYHLWLQETAPHVQDTAKAFSPNAWPVVPWTAEPRLHPTEWTVTQAMEQLEVRDPTRPFYLQVSFQRPHPPLDPPLFIWDQYRNADLDEPSIGDWVEEPGQDTHCIEPFEGRIPHDSLMRAKRAYYASITHIDSQIGRLIHYLKKKKLYDDTTIVFISDHGEMMGDHHMFRKGPFLQGSVHIPFIVKPAAGESRAKRGVRCTFPVTLLDLYPTFCDIAGLDCPAQCDGCSLLDLMENPARRPYVTSENYRQNKQVTTGGMAVMTGQYKYIWESWKGREYLFDLCNDPGECHNLSEEEAYRPLLAQLRQAVKNEYAERPFDSMLTDTGELKPNRVLKAYRKPEY